MSEQVSYGITRRGDRRHILKVGRRAACHIDVVWEARDAEADMPVCKSCLAAQNFYGLVRSLMAAAEPSAEVRRLRVIEAVWERTKATIRRAESPLLDD